MKFGVGLAAMRPEMRAAATRKAEALGFESVWMPDHLVVPILFAAGQYPYAGGAEAPISPTSPFVDPLMTLAYIAATTSRIKLGTGVFILPLRDPIATARAVLTLDHLSGGRALLGVGVGWLREEFEVVGQQWEHRGARTDECIRILRALWTEGQPQFAGQFYSFPAVGFEPKPVRRPHPPILVGGATPPALRRAATLGDGWYGLGETPESAAHRVATLRELRRAAGRDHEPFEITVGTNPTLDAVARFEAAGVDRLVVVPWTRGSEVMSGLERFADEVLSRLPAA